MPEPVEGIGSADIVSVGGVFQRHTSPRVHGLAGSASGGRWGPRGEFGVLYLGRPTDSVVIEAYRHLVEIDLDGRLTAGMIGPRNLVTCRVRLGRVLDLRSPDALVGAGLTAADLASPVGDYEACQRVGRAAHRYGLDGVMAPAASGLGETLAVFVQHISPAESLEVLSVERWDTLPSDPRLKRV